MPSISPLPSSSGVLLQEFALPFGPVGIAKSDAWHPLPERQRGRYVFFHHRADRDHGRFSREIIMSPATCVIYNPSAGRGRAERLLREERDRLGGSIELRPTKGPGHAEELASLAAVQGIDRVIAAGGDGTVHEVANGVLRSGRDVILSVWPIGSANDYAFSLGLQEWWDRRADCLPTETVRVDVGRVTGGNRERYFINTLGVGFNGMVTLESRRIPWLRGMALYGLAFLKAVAKHALARRMRFRFDDMEYDGPSLALTVNLGQREGGFPITPHADLTDGLFDYMHATRLSRWQLIRYLPRMASGRLPRDHPLIHLGRARRIEVQSHSPLCIHADGELFTLPEEGFHEAAAEVIPSRLRVEVYRPAFLPAIGGAAGPTRASE